MQETMDIESTFIAATLTPLSSPKLLLTDPSVGAGTLSKPSLWRDLAAQSTRTAREHVEYSASVRSCHDIFLVDSTAAMVCRL